MDSSGSEAGAKFALFDDGNEMLVSYFSSLEGFFVGMGDWYGHYSDNRPNEWFPLAFKARGLRFVEPIVEAGYSLDGLPQPLGNMYLQILDDSGRRIGSYWVPSVVVLDRERLGRGLSDCTMAGRVDVLPCTDAAAVWESWRHGPPTAKNEWVRLPPGRRDGWLEVVSRYELRDKSIRQRVSGESSVVLDGKNITDPASFFCALGEAVRGPGGYFGNNLSALRDCLLSDSGADGDFTLLWQDFHVAREHFTRMLRAASGPRTFIELVLEVFDRAGREVISV